MRHHTPMTRMSSEFVDLMTLGCAHQTKSFVKVRSTVGAWACAVPAVAPPSRAAARKLYSSLVPVTPEHEEMKRKEKAKSKSKKLVKT